MVHAILHPYAYIAAALSSMYEDNTCCIILMICLIHICSNKQKKLANVQTGTFHGDAEQTLFYNLTC